MNENDKDWASPSFRNVYVALAMANIQERDDNIMNWLNANGFCNLTVCPHCRVDDFVHVEGCPIDAKMDEARRMLVKMFDATARRLDTSRAMPSKHRTKQQSPN